MKKSEKFLAQFGIFLILGFGIYAIYNKHQKDVKKKEL